jgi:hypothetical protein
VFQNDSQRFTRHNALSTTYKTCSQRIGSHIDRIFFGFRILAGYPRRN